MMNESISAPTEATRTFWRREFLFSQERPGINLEIEYLRAAAVLLVMFAHADALFPKLRLGQWTGVDLFFCISGYVISRSFEQFFDQHIGEGRWWLAARAFWVRRIFRLAPSAWLWLSVGVICAGLFNSSGWFGTFEGSLKSALFFLTFTTNFTLAQGIMDSNRFFWSLTLEDQFYFMFPFFLLLFRGHWRSIVFLLFIVLQALPDRSLGEKPYPSYLWVTRLDALMWGCLIYQFSRSVLYWKLEPIFCRYRIVALAISAALIYCLIEIPKDTFEFIVGRKIESFVALASAGLVFLASFDRGYALPMPRPLQAVFAWVGARSYGLYLIHLPLFGIVKETWLRYSHLLGENPFDRRYFYAPVILVLLPILAELNFRFVESPLRRKGAQMSKQIMGRRPAMATAPPHGIAGPGPPVSAPLSRGAVQLGE
jgi:peptidoglycan/LPS O-acetylase OafA/YrhL